MIVDKIAVTYNTFEDLMERQSVIEKTALDYLEKNPIADRIESNIRLSKDKFILEVNLIAD